MEIGDWFRLDLFRLCIDDFINNMHVHKWRGSYQTQNHVSKYLNIHRSTQFIVI